MSPRKLHVASDTILLKGNKLIVRGAYAADSVNHDPVRLIQAAVDRVKSSPSLISIPVIVIPFSEKFTNSSTAYIALHPSLASMDPDAEPRCDLMEIWMHILRDTNTTWEITWAPASEGSDRCMWCRFPTLVQELSKKLDRKLTKDDVAKCLNDILKANNIAVENVFAMGTKGGLPPSSAAAVLIKPLQVDALQRNKQINTHAILPEAIQVEHVKQIEILFPFELAIVGVGVYKSLEPLLLSYLLEFEDEEGQQLASTRNPQGYRDIYVFHMSTWAATKRVLKDHEGFAKAFSKYDLTPPELLIDINDGKVAWKANTVSEGADKLAAKMDTMTRHFDKIERDVGIRLNATHQAIVDLKTSSTAMAAQLTHLACVQQSTNLTLTSMQKEISLTRRRAPLDAAESSLRMLIMLGGTEDEKEQARANIEILKAERTGIDNEISALQGATLLIPAPPSSNLNPVTPPGIPVTPTRRRSPTSADTNSSPQDIAMHKLYHAHPATPTAQGSGSKKRRLTSQATQEVNDDSNMYERSLEASGFAQPPEVQGREEEIEVEAIAKGHEDVIMAESPVHRTNSFSVTSLTATRCDVSAVVRMSEKMTHRYTRGPNGTKGFNMQRKKLNVAESCRTSRPPLSCRFTLPQNVPIFPKKATALFFVLMIVCLSLVNVVNATIPRSAFTIFSLNANGLVHTNKMAYINTAINSRKPHAFILNESKTNSKTAKNLPNADYEILEEAGVKTTNHHLYKWGVVMGVRKDVQIIQRLANLDAALKGRIIAADVALQTTSGMAYVHRIFAVYAPWDPGTNDTRAFWPALTDLVKNTTTSWSLGGDLNATVTAAERATGGSDARDKFLAFLEAVNGHDLWTGHPDRSRFYDWTSRGQDAEKNGGSIIDRVVTSNDTLIDSEIFTTNGGADFVPNTNHRAIIARIIHSPPNGGTTTFGDRPVMTTRPRIKYPSKLEAHRHDTFRKRFDERATEAGLFSMLCVNDDNSFGQLYTALGTVMITTADEAYGRVSRFRKRNESVMNDKIQCTLARVRALGGALKLIRGDHTFSPSFETT